jgi:phenylpropionate dioxygenase-like ring-hydroxylating dioxygenase large terminal subunit
VTTLETATATDAFDVDGVIRSDRVHGSVYTSGEIFRREMDTIFKTGWVYVAHDSEVSERGDYLTRVIGHDPVVVVRGKDDVVRVVLNRCTHRANKLCNAEQGNANSFRCPYHGWTFSNTGALQGVPMREGYGDAFNAVRSELGLAEAPRVDSYGGFVFASLAPDGISLREHLGKATGAIDRLLNLSPPQDRSARQLDEAPAPRQLEDGGGEQRRRLPRAVHPRLGLRCDQAREGVPCPNQGRRAGPRSR